MPLIIAVLVILVVFVSVRESKKKNDNLAAIREKDSRKTNARMEQQIVDYYMKRGYSFSDAYRKSYEDMVEAGYVPCIPRDAYSKNTKDQESSFCGYNGIFSVEKFDSFWVKEKRDEARRKWFESHNGELMPQEELDAAIYDGFPTSVEEYMHDLKRSAKRSEAYPVGSYIIYPNYGTCEILAHNWIGDGSSGGTYTLRVLKTGETVSHIKIGDSKIRRQGS